MIPGAEICMNNGGINGGDLSPDFLEFLSPAANRLSTLGKILEKRNLSYQIITLGSKNHLLVRLSPGEPRLILSAHYDRVNGSPGFLDNSMACLELADFGERFHVSGAAAANGLFLLFTDGEEAPAKEGPLAQGSYLIAKALREALGPARTGTWPSEGAARIPRGECSAELDMGTGLGLLGILVFDMTGRGEQLLLSRAPAALLDKHGLGGGQVSRALGGLELLCGRAARAAGAGRPFRIPLPWSDDLGFLLGGLPALNISLLPRGEAIAYGRFCAGRTAGCCTAAGTPVLLAAPLRSEAGSSWPPTWNLMHSAADDLSLFDPAARSLMASFLDSIPPLLAAPRTE